MQKKLLAVAMAGALGAPAIALAQSSTVQMFGTFYLEYTVRANQGDTGTPAAPVERTNADILQNPGSEIGFKGEEKLGGGLSAWFQCASSADFRGQSPEGFCSRNSALGLKGGFGNVFVGNWDTPFKRTVSPTAVGGNDTGIFGTAFLLLGNSTTTPTGGNRTAFKRRQNSMISYDSPNFGGFQLMAGFSSSNPSTATLDTAPNNKPRVLSIGGQYSAGPLYIGAGYEQLKDHGAPLVAPAPTVGIVGGAIAIVPVGGAAAAAAAGAAAATPASPTDSAWHVGAAYTWGPVRFGGQWTEQRWDTATAGGDVKVSAWHVGADWSIVGPHGLRVAYTQARDVKGPVATSTTGAVGGAFAGGAASGPGYRPAPGSDTGAKLFQIRYVYTLSKRTEFTAGYVRLDNDGNSHYRLGGFSSAINNGENEDAFAIGMRHTF